MSNNEMLREPPHSVEAENAIIGSCLIRPDVLHDITSIVSCDDFFSSNNRKIFTAMLAVQAAGVEIDAITVFERLDKDNSADDIGGLSYLTKLAVQTPSAANAKTYAKIVREKAELRRLIAIGYEITDMAYQRDANSGDIMRSVSNSLIAVEHNVGDENLLPFKSSARAYLDTLQARSEGKFQYREIGFNDLDAHLGVIEVDAQIVVGARPGMGKTAFVTNLCGIAARRGEVVLVFTMEMNRTQFMDRIISAAANIPGQKLKTGQLESRDWDDLQMAMSAITAGEIILDDSPYQTLSSMVSKARKVFRKHGRLDRIIVDYLQLTQVDKEETRATELGNISRGMKLLAKELKAHTYLLSQINRGVEERTNKRPILSDLRESGAIEQDADIVLMLYRDEVYNHDSINRGIIELGCVKNREGNVGMVPAVFRGETGRISCAAPGSYKQEERKKPKTGGYHG